MKKNILLPILSLLVLLTGCSKDPFEGKDSGSFTDSRDNQAYSWVRIGEQIWMAENLAWLPDVTPATTLSATTAHKYIYGYVGTSATDAKNTSNCQTYGVLYNYEAALKVCPDGWHCPSDADWQVLEAFLGMEPSAVASTGPRTSGDLAAKLSSVSGWTGSTIGTNSSGFNALPAGFIWETGISAGIETSACFWTSTPEGNDKAWDRYLESNVMGFDRSPYPREHAYSVRCIKD